MPRLLQRADGCYIVKHFYHESATWQIDADGVRYLADRGIKVGDMFGTDLFMHLMEMGLVYTSSHPRSPQPIAVAAAGKSLDPELEASARAAFQLLHKQDYAELHKSLASELRATMTVQDFASKIAGISQRRVSKWQLRALVSYPVHDENIPEIDRLGTVVADFETVDQTNQYEKYPSRKELWSRTNDVWYWWWRDWKDKS